MRPKFLAAVTCGVLSLGVVGSASAAPFVFDKMDDDFTRSEEQMADPHAKATIAGTGTGWQVGAVMYAKSSNDDPNSNVLNSVGISPNGSLKFDMSVPGITDIASSDVGVSNRNAGGMASYALITPDTPSYTYEVRVQVDQFSGYKMVANEYISYARGITIADIRAGTYGSTTYAHQGTLRVRLEADHLWIATDRYAWTPIDISTNVGEAYTWRFIANQDNHTVDIYRRANDSDPFVLVVQNQPYTDASSPAQLGLNIVPDLGYKSNSMSVDPDRTPIQPIVSFDYVRLGSGTAPIPEPASASILGLGGMMLLARNRHK